MRKRERNKTNKNDCSNPRGFGKIKTYAIKAVKLLAITVGCLTTSIARGTVAQAETVQTHVQAPLQYGEVQLINDKPYPKIIYFRERGEGNTTRFAYLPACTTRTLARTYSNRWEYSGDKVSFSAFGLPTDGKFLLKTSRLQYKDNGLTCLDPSQLTNEGDVQHNYKTETLESVGVPHVETELVFFNLLTVVKGGDEIAEEAAKWLGKRKVREAAATLMAGTEAGVTGAKKLSRGSKNLGNNLDTWTDYQKRLARRIDQLYKLSPSEAATQAIESQSDLLRERLGKILRFVAKNENGLQQKRVDEMVSVIVDRVSSGQTWTKEDSAILRKKLIGSVDKIDCDYKALAAIMDDLDNQIKIAVDNISLLQHYISFEDPETPAISGSVSRDTIEAFAIAIESVICAQYIRPHTKDGLVVSTR